MRYLLLVIVAVQCIMSNSLRTISISSRITIRSTRNLDGYNVLSAVTKNDDTPTWQIISDSSEIVCESSEDKKRLLISESAKTEKSIVSTSKTVSGSDKKVASNRLNASENTAFDYGLLIAFPVIIGTLALFFLFPILGPKFAESLPPPMSY